MQENMHMKGGGGGISGGSHLNDHRAATEMYETCPPGNRLEILPSQLSSSQLTAQLQPVLQHQSNSSHASPTVLETPRLVRDVRWVDAKQVPLRSFTTSGGGSSSSTCNGSTTPSVESVISSLQKNSGMIIIKQENIGSVGGGNNSAGQHPRFIAPKTCISNKISLQRTQVIKVPSHSGGAQFTIQPVKHANSSSNVSVQVASSQIENSNLRFVSPGARIIRSDGTQFLHNPNTGSYVQVIHSNVPVSLPHSNMTGPANNSPGVMQGSQGSITSVNHSQSIKFESARYGVSLQASVPSSSSTYSYLPEHQRIASPVVAQGSNYLPVSKMSGTATPSSSASYMTVSNQTNSSGLVHSPGMYQVKQNSSGMVSPGSHYVQVHPGNSQVLSHNQSVLVVNPHVLSNSPRLITPSPSVLLLNPGLLAGNSGQGMNVHSPVDATLSSNAVGNPLLKSVIVSSPSVSSSLSSPRSACIIANSNNRDSQASFMIAPTNSNSDTYTTLIPSNSGNLNVPGLVQSSQGATVPSSLGSASNSYPPGMASATSVIVSNSAIATNSVITSSSAASNPVPLGSLPILNTPSQRQVIVGQLPFDTTSNSPTLSVESPNNKPNEFLGFTNTGQMVWIKRLSIPATTGGSPSNFAGSLNVVVSNAQTVAQNSPGNSLPQTQVTSFLSPHANASSGYIGHSINSTASNYSTATTTSQNYSTVTNSFNNMSYSNMVTTSMPLPTPLSASPSLVTLPGPNVVASPSSEFPRRYSTIPSITSYSNNSPAIIPNTTNLLPCVPSINPTISYSPSPVMNNAPSSLTPAVVSTQSTEYSTVASYPTNVDVTTAHFVPNVNLVNSSTGLMNNNTISSIAQTTMTNLAIGSFAPSPQVNNSVTVGLGSELRQKTCISSYQLPNLESRSTSTLPLRTSEHANLPTSVNFGVTDGSNFNNTSVTNSQQYTVVGGVCSAGGLSTTNAYINVSSSDSNSVIVNPSLSTAVVDSSLTSSIKHTSEVTTPTLPVMNYGSLVHLGSNLRNPTYATSSYDPSLLCGRELSSLECNQTNVSSEVPYSSESNMIPITENSQCSVNVVFTGHQAVSDCFNDSLTTVTSSEQLYQSSDCNQPVSQQPLPVQTEIPACTANASLLRIPSLDNFPFSSSVSSGIVSSAEGVIPVTNSGTSSMHIPGSEASESEQYSVYLPGLSLHDQHAKETTGGTPAPYVLSSNYVEETDDGDTQSIHHESNAVENHLPNPTMLLDASQVDDCSYINADSDTSCSNHASDINTYTTIPDKDSSTTNLNSSVKDTLLHLVMPEPQGNSNTSFMSGSANTTNYNIEKEQTINQVIQDNQPTTIDDGMEFDLPTTRIEPSDTSNSSGTCLQQQFAINNTNSHAIMENVTESDATYSEHYKDHPTAIIVPPMDALSTEECFVERTSQMKAPVSGESSTAGRLSAETTANFETSDFGNINSDVNNSSLVLPNLLSAAVPVTQSEGNVYLAMSITAGESASKLPVTADTPSPLTEISDEFVQSASTLPSNNKRHSRRNASKAAKRSAVKVKPSTPNIVLPVRIPTPQQVTECSSKKKAYFTTSRRDRVKQNSSIKSSTVVKATTVEPLVVDGSESPKKGKMDCYDFDEDDDDCDSVVMTSIIPRPVSLKQGLLAASTVCYGTTKNSSPSKSVELLVIVDKDSASNSKLNVGYSQEAIENEHTCRDEKSGSKSKKRCAIKQNKKLRPFKIKLSRSQFSSESQEENFDIPVSKEDSSKFLSPICETNIPPTECATVDIINGVVDVPSILESDKSIGSNFQHQLLEGPDIETPVLLQNKSTILPSLEVVPCFPSEMEDFSLPEENAVIGNSHKIDKNTSIHDTLSSERFLSLPDFEFSTPHADPTLKDQNLPVTPVKVRPPDGTHFKEMDDSPTQNLRLVLSPNTPSPKPMQNALNSLPISESLALTVTQHLWSNNDQSSDVVNHLTKTETTPSESSLKPKTFIGSSRPSPKSKKPRDSYFENKDVVPCQLAPVKSSELAAIGLKATDDAPGKVEKKPRKPTKQQIQKLLRLYNKYKPIFNLQELVITVNKLVPAVLPIVLADHGVVTDSKELDRMMKMLLKRTPKSRPNMRRNPATKIRINNIIQDLSQPSPFDATAPRVSKSSKPACKKSSIIPVLQNPALTWHVSPCNGPSSLETMPTAKTSLAPVSEATNDVCPFQVNAIMDLPVRLVESKVPKKSLVPLALEDSKVAREKPVALGLEKCEVANENFIPLVPRRDEVPQKNVVSSGLAKDGIAVVRFLTSEDDATHSNTPSQPAESLTFGGSPTDSGMIEDSFLGFEPCCDSPELLSQSTSAKIWAALEDSSNFDPIPSPDDAHTVGTSSFDQTMDSLDNTNDLGSDAEEDSRPSQPDAGNAVNQYSPVVPSITLANAMSVHKLSSTDNVISDSGAGHILSTSSGRPDASCAPKDCSGNSSLPSETSLTPNRESSFDSIPLPSIVSSNESPSATAASVEPGSDFTQVLSRPDEITRSDFNTLGNRCQASSEMKLSASALQTMTQESCAPLLARQTSVTSSNVPIASNATPVLAIQKVGIKSRASAPKTSVTPFLLQASNTSPSCLVTKKVDNQSLPKSASKSAFDAKKVKPAVSKHCKSTKKLVKSSSQSNIMLVSDGPAKDLLLPMQTLIAQTTPIVRKTKKVPKSAKSREKASPAPKTTSTGPKSASQSPSTPQGISDHLLSTAKSKSLTSSTKPKNISASPLKILLSTKLKSQSSATKVVIAASSPLLKKIVKSKSQSPSGKSRITTTSVIKMVKSKSQSPAGKARITATSPALKMLLTTKSKSQSPSPMPRTNSPLGVLQKTSDAATSSTQSPCSSPMPPSLSSSKPPSRASSPSVAGLMSYAPRVPKVAVLKYQPPLSQPQQGEKPGNYPFSESLRKIIQNAQNPGSIRKRPLKRRIKVTPIIPASLTRPPPFKSHSNSPSPSSKKAGVLHHGLAASRSKKGTLGGHRSGDTYIFSEYESDFVNLNRLYSSSLAAGASSNKNLEAKVPSSADGSGLGSGDTVGTVKNSNILDVDQGLHLEDSSEDEFGLDSKEFAEEVSSKLEASCHGVGSQQLPNAAATSTWSYRSNSKTCDPGETGDASAPLMQTPVGGSRKGISNIPGKSSTVDKVVDDQGVDLPKSLPSVSFNKQVSSADTLPPLPCGPNSQLNALLGVPAAAPNSRATRKILPRGMLPPGPKSKKLFQLRKVLAERNQNRGSVMGPLTPGSSLSSSCGAFLLPLPPPPNKVDRSIVKACPASKKRNLDFVDWRDGELIGSYAPHPLCKKPRTTAPSTATLQQQQEQQAAADAALSIEKKKKKKSHKAHNYLAAMNAALRRMNFISGDGGLEEEDEKVDLDGEEEDCKKKVALESAADPVVKKEEKDGSCSEQPLGDEEGVDRSKVEEKATDLAKMTPGEEVVGTDETSVIKSEGVKDVIKVEPPTEITVRDIQRAMAMKKVRNYEEFRTNVLNYLSKGRECNPLLVLFKVSRRKKKKKVEQFLLVNKPEDELDTSKVTTDETNVDMKKETKISEKDESADPCDKEEETTSLKSRKLTAKPVTQEEKESVGASLWIAVQEEVDKINARHKEEMKLIIKDARARAAITKSMNRLAALKETSGGASSGSAVIDSELSCNSFESEYITLDNVDTMEWSDDPLGTFFLPEGGDGTLVTPGVIPHTGTTPGPEQQGVTLSRYQKKKLRKIEMEVKMMKRERERRIMRRSRSVLSSGEGGVNSSASKGGITTDVSTAEFLTYFTDNEDEEDDDFGDDDHVDDEDGDLHHNEEVHPESEELYYDDIYRELLEGEFGFLPPLLPSAKLHDKSDHKDDQNDDGGVLYSDEEEDNLPEPVDMAKFLNIDTFHGHIFENLPDEEEGRVQDEIPKSPAQLEAPASEGEQMTPLPSTVPCVADVPCSFVPFTEPVDHNATQAHQIKGRTRIVLKRLRFVHIVNRFCKRHRINLRAAFRIRRRLRYWEDRNDELAIIEAYKNAPRTLDDFLSHAVFAEAFMDPEEANAYKRKRLMIEFDRMKCWEEYDDDFDDDYYDKKFRKAMGIKDASKAQSVNSGMGASGGRASDGGEGMPASRMGQHSSEASFMGGGSVGRSAIPGVDEHGHVLGMFGRPKLPADRTGPLHPQQGGLTPPPPASPLPAGHGTVVFNYEKRRYEVMPLANSEKFGAGGRHLQQQQQLQQSQLAAALAGGSLNLQQQQLLQQQLALSQNSSQVNKPKPQQQQNILLHRVTARDATGQLVTIRSIQTPSGNIVKVVTRADGSHYKIGPGGTLEKLPRDIRLPDTISSPAASPAATPGVTSSSHNATPPSANYHRSTSQQELQQQLSPAQLAAQAAYAQQQLQAKQHLGGPVVSSNGSSPSGYASGPNMRPNRMDNNPFYHQPPSMHHPMQQSQPVASRLTPSPQSVGSGGGQSPHNAAMSLPTSNGSNNSSNMHHQLQHNANLLLHYQQQQQQQQQHSAASRMMMEPGGHVSQQSPYDSVPRTSPTMNPHHYPPHSVSPSGGVASPHHMHPDTGGYGSRTAAGTIFPPMGAPTQGPMRPSGSSAPPPPPRLKFGPGHRLSLTPQPQPPQMMETSRKGFHDQQQAAVAAALSGSGAFPPLNIPPHLLGQFPLSGNRPPLDRMQQQQLMHQQQMNHQQQQHLQQRRLHQQMLLQQQQQQQQRKLSLESQQRRSSVEKYETSFDFSNEGNRPVASGRSDGGSFTSSSPQSNPQQGGSRGLSNSSPSTTGAPVPTPPPPGYDEAVTQLLAKKRDLQISITSSKGEVVVPLTDVSSMNASSARAKSKSSCSNNASSNNSNVAMSPPPIPHQRRGPSPSSLSTGKGRSPPPTTLTSSPSSRTSPGLVRGEGRSINRPTPPLMTNMKGPIPPPMMQMKGQTPPPPLLHMKGGPTPPPMVQMRGASSPHPSPGTSPFKIPTPPPLHSMKSGVPPLKKFRPVNSSSCTETISSLSRAEPELSSGSLLAKQLTKGGSHPSKSKASPSSSLTAEGSQLRSLLLDANVNGKPKSKIDRDSLPEDRSDDSNKPDYKCNSGEESSSKKESSEIKHPSKVDVKEDSIGSILMSVLKQKPLPRSHVEQDGDGKTASIGAGEENSPHWASGNNLSTESPKEPGDAPPSDKTEPVEVKSPVRTVADDDEDDPIRGFYDDNNEQNVNTDDEDNDNLCGADNLQNSSDKDESGTNGEGLVEDNEGMFGLMLKDDDVDVDRGFRKTARMRGKVIEKRSLEGTDEGVSPGGGLPFDDGVGGKGATDDNSDQVSKKRCIDRGKRSFDIMSLLNDGGKKNDDAEDNQVQGDGDRGDKAGDDDAAASKEPEKEQRKAVDREKADADDRLEMSEEVSGAKNAQSSKEINSQKSTESEVTDSNKDNTVKGSKPDITTAAATFTTTSNSDSSNTSSAPTTTSTPTTTTSTTTSSASAVSINPTSNTAVALKKIKSEQVDNVIPTSSAGGDGASRCSTPSSSVASTSLCLLSETDISSVLNEEEQQRAASFAAEFEETVEFKEEPLDASIGNEEEVGGGEAMFTEPSPSHGSDDEDDNIPIEIDTAQVPAAAAAAAAAVAAAVIAKKKGMEKERPSADQRLRSDDFWRAGAERPSHHSSEGSRAVVAKDVSDLQQQQLLAGMERREATLQQIKQLQDHKQRLQQQQQPDATAAPGSNSRLHPLLVQQKQQQQQLLQQLHVQKQHHRRLQYIQESQLMQQQLAAAAAAGVPSSSALSLAAAIAHGHRDPDGETMLSFPPKELPHCGRPDPDQHRTAAQVSPIVNVIRLALCAGYPPVEHHIRSAVYQLSLAWGICCKYHAIGLAEWQGLTKMLGLKLLADPGDSLSSSSSNGSGASEAVIMFTPPVVPSIPSMEQIYRGLDVPSPSDTKARSLIIVERLVFAVDRRSREVFLPLPNWVESVSQIEFDLESHMSMKRSNSGGAGGGDSNTENAAGATPTSNNSGGPTSGRANNPSDSRPSQPNPSSVELLSVIVSFTPAGGLLPGLIVFPGALMTFRLRHSLDGATGGRDWILSSRGGWRSKNGKCTRTGGDSSSSASPSSASNTGAKNDASREGLQAAALAKCCSGGQSSTTCKGSPITCGNSPCSGSGMSASSGCSGEIHLDNSDRGPIEEYLSRLVVGWGKANLAPPLFLHLPQQYHYAVTGKYDVGGDCCCKCLCKTKPSGSSSSCSSSCPKHSQHQHVVPNVHRVVQDVGIVTSTHDCISIILGERVAANWGVMVRQWTQKNGALLEHTFPSFLLHYLPVLLNAGLVKRFARVAGLDTFDRKRMERFNRHTEEYRKRWQWGKK